MYRKIEIPNYGRMAKNIYEYILSRTDIVKEKQFWTAIGVQDFINGVPDIYAYFDQYNLHFRCVGVVYVAPTADPYELMHIDSALEIRGLLPIRNCEGSYTKFYDYGDQELLTHDAAGEEFYLCPPNPKLCTEIDRVELTQPIFIDTSVLHSVAPNPNTTSYRLSLTLGFTSRPTNFSFLDNYASIV